MAPQIELCRFGTHLTISEGLAFRQPQSPQIISFCDQIIPNFYLEVGYEKTFQTPEPHEAHSSKGAHVLAHS